jgi:hypothetical protein
MAQRAKTIKIVSLRMVREASLRDQYGTVSAPEDVRIMVKNLIGKG